MTKTTADRHAMHRAWHDNGLAIFYESDQSDDVKLQREDTYVLVEKPLASEGGDAYTIELPPVANCKGLVFLVKMIDPDTGDKNVTVKSLGDASGAQINTVLTAAGDYVVIENVGGEAWRMLEMYTQTDLTAMKTLAQDQSGDVDLAWHETLIEVAQPDSAYAINLPAIEKCKNQRFMIYMVAGGSNAATVTAPDDGLNAQITHALNAADDYSIIQNVDGKVWVALDSETTV